METIVKQKKAYSYIRFSSAEQLKGDSKRRQFEATKLYVKENNLILDTNYKDEGISAFSGKHKLTGALSRFLKSVEAKEIEKGSILIVENLDRLSRENVLDALTLFTSIIQAGIEIVTLQDGMIYSTKNITKNWTQLIISITYMARAHDESQVKSDRLKSVWKNKREKASKGEIFTKKCPSWIEFKKDKFVLIPERVQAVREIYRMRLDGMGKMKIARSLNQRNDLYIPPVTKLNKLGGWTPCYINKILTSKTVIGTMQPMRRINVMNKKTGKLEKKRREVGDGILNYYPSAIEQTFFNQVQNLIAKNFEQRGFAGGRLGKVSNLFTHIAKCGLCGANMHYINKGYGNTHLTCCSHDRKTGCNAKKVNYSEFEKLFFKNMEELNISEFLPNVSEQKFQINKIEKNYSSKQYELLETEKGIENITNTIALTKDERVRLELTKKQIKLFNEKEFLIKELNSLNLKKENLKIEIEHLQKNINTAKEIYSFLNSVKDEKERINARLRLRQEIKKIVKRIDIYPLQEKYVEAKEIEPGIVRFMNSKYIDKVRITFQGSNTRILYLKSYGVKQ